MLGAGTMGNGIAHVLAKAGYQVVLRDVEQRFLDRALETISKMRAMNPASASPSIGPARCSSRWWTQPGRDEERRGYHYEDVRVGENRCRREPLLKDEFSPPPKAAYRADSRMNCSA